MATEPKGGGLSPNDWSLIAEWIRNEKERRAENPRRKDMERVWKEIDRQVAMIPLPRTPQPGSKPDDWLPNTELPLQFNTLEVNCADARRLKFPRGSEWFAVSADISAEYEERFSARRERFPMVGGMAVPMAMNQETANTLVKSTVDHFHRLYDFRAMVDLFDVECLKYGTGILRVKEVSTPKFFNDFRGTKVSTARGPACVPQSIKNTYLDDSPLAAMMEGITMAPGHIRVLWKKLDDVKNAIKTGGPERGWRQEAINKLEPNKSQDDKQQHVEMIEFEGDLVVPRGRGKSIFLPGVIVTIGVCGKNPPEVLRFLENDYPFSSYTVGYYMRDGLEYPYGTSPLIKGQPLQEAATELLNDILAAAAIAGIPPCFYDKNDPGLTAQGGPNLFPRSMNAVESPEAVKFMDRPDIQYLVQAYMAIVKQYEDLTAVNDPRRGGGMKSHTTATAMDLEQSRGLARTDDFVQGQLYGPITSLLYKEFEVIKRVLKTPQPIQADSGGIEGWINVAAADLPDSVAFAVFGAAGLLNERQGLENFMAATNSTLQMIPIAAQLGSPIPIDFERLSQEIFRRAGINNAATFLGAKASAGAQPVPGGTEGGQPVPGASPGIPTNTLTDISRLLKV